MRIWTIVAVVLTALTVPAAGIGSPGGAPGSELAAVRAATAKYHDVSAAIADGYVVDPGCVESPVGGMGFHTVNFAAFMNPLLDPLHPEALLYAPSPSGGYRLVGVEYRYA